MPGFIQKHQPHSNDMARGNKVFRSSKEIQGQSACQTLDYKSYELWKIEILESKQAYAILPGNWRFATLLSNMETLWVLCCAIRTLLGCPRWSIILRDSEDGIPFTSAEGEKGA